MKLFKLRSLNLAHFYASRNKFSGLQRVATCRRQFYRGTPDLLPRTFFFRVGNKVWKKHLSDIYFFVKF
jgi:hypothetical protein